MERYPILSLYLTPQVSIMNNTIIFVSCFGLFSLQIPDYDTWSFLCVCLCFTFFIQGQQPMALGSPSPVCPHLNLSLRRPCLHMQSLAGMSCGSAVAHSVIVTWSQGIIFCLQDTGPGVSWSLLPPQLPHPNFPQRCSVQ